MSDSQFWNQIYNTKSEEEVSWFQETPIKSLELIQELVLPPSAKIIDVGGGESRLVDHLLKLGFSNLTVLDISSIALEKTKLRLNESHNKVQFISSNVLEFDPKTKFDLWHDRAAFHFLTNKDQIEKYVSVLSSAMKPDGSVIISTFSKTGPEKCSGLPITRYSASELEKIFGCHFRTVKFVDDIHITPWNSKQAFLFGVFKPS